MRRLAVLLVGAVCVLAASPGPASAAKRKPPRCGERSTQVRCLKTLRGREALAKLPNGRVPRTAALQAFAARLAPLPGVRVRRGAAGEAISGTPALRAILSHERSLSRAQRRAVRRFRATGLPPGKAARSAAAPPAAAVAEWRGLMDAARGRIAARLGVAPTIPLELLLLPVDLGDGTYGMTDPDAGRCRVRIYPNAWGGLPADSKAFVAAHEAMHCFQLQIQTEERFNLAGLSWLMEGGANWAAATIGAEEGRDLLQLKRFVGHWNAWLLSPGTSLFRRDYSAVGFFSLLDASGTDTWAAMRRMLAADSAQEAYAEAGSGHLGSWSATYFRAPALGAGWDLAGPGITGARPQIPEVPIGDGQLAQVGTDPRSAAERSLELSADVVEVTGVKAYGRLLDADGIDRGLATGAYCAKPDGCADRPEGCPQLSAIARGAARLALAADDAPAVVRVRGRSLEQWCGDPKRVKPASGVGAASATDLQISGALPRRFREDGACIDYANLGRVVIQFVEPGANRSVDTLQFDLKWSGPGTYTGRPHDVSYTPGAGDDRVFEGYQTDTGRKDALGYPVIRDSYTVRVEADEGGFLRGTVNADLRHDGSGTSVTATGGWRCRWVAGPGSTRG